MHQNHEEPMATLTIFVLRFIFMIIIITSSRRRNSYGLGIIQQHQSQSPDFYLHEEKVHQV